MKVQGFYDEKFAKLHDVFAESFSDDVADVNTELGASIALYLDGEPVVDLWGGYTDETMSSPWREDTIVCTQSVGKGPLALCAHILVEQGLLDLEKPMAHYWPEFAQKGKEDFPVKWALSHSIGLPAWEHAEPGMGYDWRAAVDGLAASKPDLVAGKEHSYHPYTYGFLVGEIIERVSGKSVQQFLAEYVTGPLGVDFQYGVKPEDKPRTATFTKLRHGDNIAGVEAGLGDMGRRTMDVLDHDEDYNSDKWRSAVIPAANGHTNARALSRLYGALALGGTLGGVRVVSEETLAKATELQWGGSDPKWPLETNVALGFMLNCPAFPSGPNPRSFGHSGFGGAYGFADPDAKMGFGYTPNKIWMGMKVETGRRCDRLVEVAYECLQAAT